MIRKFLSVFIIFLATVSFVNAQTGTAVGNIVDGSGLPLIGANVVVKGTTIGTISDVDGNYKLEGIPEGSQVLVSSFIGFGIVEVPVKVVANQTVSANFTLIEDITSLDELVVIGYGTVKKSDATGSVSTVSAKDFNRGNVTSAQDLIVGKTAGVVITSAGGAPGSGSTIRIRGGSSLNASNDPLIIVDGVPISNTNPGGSSNIMSFINPNDIETFTVLKDASATAIYGSRASNGVILITTKKGKSGKPLEISYNGSYSIAAPIAYVDVYSGDEFRQSAEDHKALYDAKLYSRMDSANTDWQNEIFRDAFTQDHNVSLSGAYKILPYRFSVGYTDQQGILVNTDMQRLTGAVSLDPSFFDNSLKVNVNAKVMSTMNNFGDAGAIGSAVSMDPTQYIYDTTNSEATGGYFQWANKYSGADLGTPNPVAQALEVDNKSNVTRFVGNIQLNYALPFLPDLKANLNVATDVTDGTGHNNHPLTTPSNLRTSDNLYSEYNNSLKNDLLDFYLNYGKELGEIHSINATGGYSWQHFSEEGDNYGHSHPSDTVYKMADSSQYSTENYLVSFFGRVNYTLNEKYLLTGTIRYDGSSRFSEGNRGVFPSAAFAWKINKEAFMAGANVVSDLKLRLGWGITGQQDIGNDYPAQALYVESRPGSYYPLGGKFLSTLRPNAYDPQIKWEETTTLNAGIDYGFYEGRISGAVDIYRRVTDDLLNQTTVASGSNFSNILFTNVGSLENKGIEASINLIPVSTTDMTLNVGFNLTYNKNEITKLLLTDDPNYIGVLYGDAFTGYNQVTRVGYPAYSYFVNKQVYDTEGNPLEGLYEDLSGEGGAVREDNADKYIYHDPAPDFLLGFNLRFSYKQFDLAASARANIGNYVYNRVGAGASYNQMQQIGYWKNMPYMLEDTKFVTRQFTSDYFVSNASFLKIDNISAGYNFEKIADSKLNLRLSFTVQNLLTVTKYKGLDPEVDGGIDNNFYPRPRTYTVGISLNY